MHTRRMPCGNEGRDITSLAMSDIDRKPPEAGREAGNRVSFSGSEGTNPLNL